MKRKRELTLEEFDSWQRPLQDVTNQLQNSNMSNVDVTSRRNSFGKRCIENTSREKVERDIQTPCCPSRCIENIPLDVCCGLREKFWNLVIAEQNREIVNHRIAVSSEMCVLAGRFVCTECWRLVHGVSRSRYFEQKKLPSPPSDGRKGMKYGHRRYSELANYLGSLGEKQGEKLPDKPKVTLPTCLTQKNTYEEYVASHSDPYCFRHFQRVWKERFPDMRASEKTTFTECRECAMIRQLKSQRLTKEQLLKVEDQKRAHLLVARIAREKYYKHCKKALDQPDKYLSMIIDNMDQAKTTLPRFPTYHKGDATLTRIHHHVTGVLAHGQKAASVFTWTDKFACDSNITINCLLKVLEDVSTNKSLPPTLYLQADNSAKDNKNYILMGLLANLVRRGIFKKVKLSFLMVGHTHEDVDQMFSRLSVHLSGMAVPTLARLQQLVQEAYSPTPTVHHLENLWDYRQLGIQAPVHLNGHSTPHSFRFTKVGDDVVMSYKEWPLKSNSYHSIAVTDLAKAFDGEPDPIQQVTDKGERVFAAMEEDLRKWRDGGKLSDGHVSWWREHLERERRFPMPRIPKVSSFEPHLRVHENPVSLPAMEVLDNHISNLRKQSQVCYL
ncbi:uncharacterized protein LOC134259225 isoform X2 [Saccostrea cucullata]|uniref:uncharacterized protein LOC134259225 isoform X2 n=1 Tax=Saccostrea cuccullata TaxID=36930 RepID=UPI002ED6AFDD